MSQVTTHILDTTTGRPAANVPICFYRQDGEGWQKIACSVTNSDGRIADLLDDAVVLDAGVYRMNFDTKSYFDAQQGKTFYPYVDIVFSLEGGGEHYHIPLLLSAYGYSSYRGS